MYNCDPISLCVVRRMIESETRDWLTAGICQINGSAVIFHGSVKTGPEVGDWDFVGGVDLFDLRRNITPNEFDELIQKLNDFENRNSE